MKALQLTHKNIIYLRCRARPPPNQPKSAEPAGSAASRGRGLKYVRKRQASVDKGERIIHNFLSKKCPPLCAYCSMLQWRESIDQDKPGYSAASIASSRGTSHTKTQRPKERVCQGKVIGHWGIDERTGEKMEDRKRRMHVYQSWVQTRQGK